MGRATHRPALDLGHKESLATTMPTQAHESHVVPRQLQLVDTALASLV